MNGVNRLATKGEKYYWLPRKLEKITDYSESKIINRLPTWTDIIDICFQKEEYFVFFGSNQIKFWLVRWSNGKNFRFVYTHTCILLQPISKSEKSYIEDTSDFKYFIEKAKVKSWTFLVSIDGTSLYSSTPQKKGYRMSLRSVGKFLRRQSSYS